MTSHTDKGPKPKRGKLLNFDHVTFWVGNAVQAASYYCARMGFEPWGYRGLETGSRKKSTQVIRQNNIFLVFETFYETDFEEMIQHVIHHGDAVRDVAFNVEDLDGILEVAKKHGARVARDTWEERDEHGTVRRATIHTFGDTLHTFVERTNYHGEFLPGFKPCKKDPIQAFLPDAKLDFIDHLVGNQPEHEMENVVQWYEKCLQFHRFWSVDDKQLHGEYSALRSWVISNWEGTIKIPINEPAPGKKRSQIQEFLDYHEGPGVQHVGFHSNDIIKSIENLRARGVEFLYVPDKYYDDLRERLKNSSIKVAEDLDMLQKLNILMDFDENGYLLQIFSKNILDRPTFYIEVIQRANHFGFGAGNFKALFEAAEYEQSKRGNL